MIHVLIIDDSVADRFLLKRAIRQSGSPVRLFEAASGAEGLELMRRTSMAVVFLDRRMPGLDGIEVLREIRRTTSSTWPVVVLFSSSALPQDVAVAYANHANLYVQKPVDNVGYESLATSLLPTVLEMLPAPSL